MTLISAVPFRTTPTSAVAAAPWHVQTDEGLQPLPRVLPHWDYNQRLLLTRTIQLDSDALLTACQLSSNDPLRIVAVWSCPGNLDTVVPGAVRVLLEGTVDGHELSGELRIETHLVLLKQRPNGVSLAATRPGSILWRDASSSIVEGGAPRFPVEVVDFSHTLWAPPSAAWYLSWNPLDLRQPFLGTVRLMINSGIAPVVRAVARNDSDASAKAIRSTIHFEVGRTLIRGALCNDEFRSDPEGFPEGTVGRALSRLVGLLFPGDSPEGLKNLMDQRPEFFDSVLQEKLKLFHV
jgi:hypothetical protein